MAAKYKSVVGRQLEPDGTIVEHLECGHGIRWIGWWHASERRQCHLCSPELHNGCDLSPASPIENRSYTPR